VSEPRDPPDATRATPRRAKAKRVGPYRVEGELGRGGMGVVYRAFDERLHRDVALKALPADLAADAEARARMEREARAIALVSHANVAAIHGLEESEDTLYLVLELIEGETLRERLDRGALALDEALATCGHVAAGPAAVHRKGLVHRDLKPSNVMVTSDGIAKLLDFGLARRVRDESRSGRAGRDEIVGTSGYMSPEQLRGEEVDARSDAFAWGCLLYECLAGAPAFPGATWGERDVATLGAEPDWTRVPSAAPEGIVELLRSCLSKERGPRPSSLDDARRLLDEARLTSSARKHAAKELPRHFLPAERDAFVGREQELAELAQLVDDGARLMSVLGIGGTGKTRLVLHLARRVLPSFPGGAWFCDLSEARSVEGIASAVAAALDVPLGKDEPVTQLGHAIAGRGRCLVILDNFEQVARHAGVTLGQWLDRAGEATFVVTTREVLGLAGERSLALAPLVPKDATELFVERARAVRSDFAPDEAERAEIDRLVKLLDHLPLAIELAAARVRVMPPRVLLERMSERFKLLTSSGARQTRQTTLRATFDWSWELLSEDEKSALAQLSVFEGGFTLEAAEAVLSLPQLWPADAVQALVDKSWVRPVSDGRFDLLVSVQEYASEKLSALGGREEAEARHGAHFATHGTDEALARFNTHGGAARWKAAALELDNLVAASRRAVLRGEGSTAASTFMAAARVLALKGPNLASAELGMEVLEVGTLAPHERARACGATGRALVLVGRTEEALPHVHEALAIAREIGDRRCEAHILRLLGFLHQGKGRMSDALPCLDSALAIAREVGDRDGEMLALHRLGLHHALQARMDEAPRPLEAALAIARELGNRMAEGDLLIDLGLLHKNTGRMEEALRHFMEAHAIHREVGNRRSEATVLNCMGVVRGEQGQLEEALRRYHQSLAIHREVGNRAGECNVLTMLGNLQPAQGGSDEALRYYQQALAIAREIGNPNMVGNILGNLGSLCLKQGRMDDALRYLQDALTELRGTGNRRNEGWVLTSLGGLHARRGHIADARAVFEQAEALLRGAGDSLGLGNLLCARARLDHAEGRADTARVALAEAESLAAAIGAGPESGLGHDLAEVRALLHDGSTPPAR
jgi:predicted ATPase